MNIDFPTAAPRRDARFDSVRGLMLALMTVDHLPSSLRILTDRSYGICSAAEGFVFLSGLVAGIVYTRRCRRDGAVALREAARRRVYTIYGWHLGAYLSAFAAVKLTALLFGFFSRAAPQLFFAHPFWALVLGSAMLYQPGLLDILPLYCALFAALPFILSALEAGRRRLVLAGSFGLWLAVQGMPPMKGFLLYPIHLGSFNLFAWQFLFVLGVAIGHARETEPGPQITPRVGLVVGCIAIAVFGWGIRHLNWRGPWPDHFYGVTLNKPALGFLRLADFGALAYLIAVLGTAFPALVSWRPLAFLGRHSLPVVAVQSVVAIVVLQFPALFATPCGNWATTTAAVALLFVTAGLHKAWQALPRHSAGRFTIGAERSDRAPPRPAEDARVA